MAEEQDSLHGVWFLSLLDGNSLPRRKRKRKKKRIKVNRKDIEWSYDKRNIEKIKRKTNKCINNIFCANRKSKGERIERRIWEKRRKIERFSRVFMSNGNNNGRRIKIFVLMVFWKRQKTIKPNADKKRTRKRVFFYCPFALLRLWLGDTFVTNLHVIFVYFHVIFVYSSEFLGVFRHFCFWHFRAVIVRSRQIEHHKRQKGTDKAWYH